MGPVWLTLRTGLRGGWRAWLALALLLGIMGGTALAAAAGAWCVRVHVVPPNADAVLVAAAWRGSQ